MLYELYPAAVDAGMKGSEFWESSLPDIMEQIKSSERRKRHEISMQFVLAEVIANRIFRKEDTPALMPWDYFPQLFCNDKKRYEQNKAEEELENFKERRRRAMDAHNAKRHRQEVSE